MGILKPTDPRLLKDQEPLPHLTYTVETDHEIHLRLAIPRVIELAERARKAQMRYTKNINSSMKHFKGSAAKEWYKKCENSWQELTDIWKELQAVAVPSIEDEYANDQD